MQKTMTNTTDINPAPLDTLDPLVGLAERLRVYFNEKYKPGSVSIGIGGEILHVYIHAKGIDRVLPAWMAAEGVPVEFHYVGIVRPA